MPKKIYVGNLNYATEENELEKLFTQYGTVTSCRVITDRYTNRSKGFGFVEMEDAESADTAISALNGTELSGRTLKVNEAHDRGERPRNNYS